MSDAGTNSSYPRLPFFFRWYIRNELPGNGRLYGLLGLGGFDNVNPRWRGAPTLKTRGKLHGYLMALDLRRDLDRQTYFLGRYYDLNIQLLLAALLKEGDTFVDGGANTGMMTLMAAHLVGASGRVVAFEPIPANCARIQAAVDENAIDQVTIVNKGLGNKSETLKLHILGGDTIMSTFRGNEDQSDERDAIDVPVVRGDDLIAPLLAGPLTIKLDLEGWEFFAMEGVERTIAEQRPPLILEIEPRYLKDAGVDEVTIHEWMVARNYQPYVIGYEKRFLGTPRLQLAPYETAQDLVDLNDFANPRFAALRQALGKEAVYVDVLWLPRDNSRFDVTPYLVG